VLLVLFAANPLHANEDALSITIAPPLIQIGLQPGESWASGISVVNNNNYAVTLYAEPYIFKPVDETGRPHFLSPSDLEHSSDIEAGLTSWITLPQTGFTIEPGQTYILPIVIDVPEGAAPGGHYSAILIGNKTPKNTQEGGTVSVSSSVASLIFLSVAGDVTEKGRIRDFYTEKTLYQDAEAKFSLRFENQGNVHLVPRGNIKIFNMFGKERGYIPVNSNSRYGNVLPESKRKFDFSWKSDSGLWDIGRYKAEATINYGSDLKQSTLRTTYFYILPIVPLLQILFGLIAVGLFVSWALKAYVRRALAIETQHLLKDSVPQKKQRAAESQKVSVGTLVRPIQAGLVDLRRTTASGDDVYADERITTSTVVEHMSLKTFIWKYKLFFLFIFFGLIVWFGVSLYVEDVMVAEREYDVSELRPDGSVVELPNDHLE
jgi:hypothetical protein